MWFHGDEWDVLVTRDGADLASVFEATNFLHWTTIPVLFYRAMFQVVGLRHYLPYQVPAIALHLLAAVLLRRIMIRSEVDAWIATAAASLFALFGTAHQNLFWAFQISFNGALAMGLLQLDLATHDGPVNRRDVGGLAAGAIGLMCSGVAIPMTMTVGIATFIKRGWKPAAFHTVPLGLTYAVWWLGYAQTSEATDRSRGTPAQWIDFIWIGLRSTFANLGQIPGVGIVLAVVLVLGVGLVWRSAQSHGARVQRLAAPLALVVGAVAFLWITALGRVAAGLGPFDVVLGTELANSSRYLHVVAALCLPAIAVGADEFRRRWAFLGPVAVLIFVVGIPGNINEFVDPVSTRLSERPQQATRAQVLALSESPLLDDAPGDYVPYLAVTPMTVDWLRQQVADGNLPDPGDVSPQLRADADALLAFVPTLEREARCVTLADPSAATVLGPGEQLSFTAAPRTTVTLVYVTPEGLEAAPRLLPVDLVSIVEAVADDITVRVEPDPAIERVERCSPAD